MTDWAEMTVPKRLPSEDHMNKRLLSKRRRHRSAISINPGLDEVPTMVKVGVDSDVLSFARSEVIAGMFIAVLL